MLLVTKFLEFTNARDNLVKEFIDQNKPIETIEKIYDVFPNLDKKF